MDERFDRELDRRGTGSVKWELAEALGKPADLIPMWVADMDFRAPEVVTDALRERVEHGVFGYSMPTAGYDTAVIDWFRLRHGWEARAEWIVKTPGVVFALATAVSALTGPGDAVLVQPPVYFPFFDVVKNQGRRLVENPLRFENGRYEMDFPDLERKLRDERVKLLLLCSPHNPVGRVWTPEELRHLAALCERYDVLLVSDEIHCDFAFSETPHTVTLRACPEIAERTVMCTAPSKSFNLAGLQTSNLFIPNEGLRSRFRAALDRMAVNGPNALGLVAGEAAYRGGAAWLDACRRYLRGNLDCLRDFLRERLPEIKLVEPEGTYFAWLDCSALGLEPEALDKFITERAKLWLDAGTMFGRGGEQFQRVVLACPRATLQTALERLERAVRVY